MAVKLKSCDNLWASEIIKAKSRIVYKIPYRRVREQSCLAYNTLENEFVHNQQSVVHYE